MVLRILSVTLVAIDISILKILERTLKLCVFVANILPIESQIEETAGKFIYIHIFEYSFRFFDFDVTASHVNKKMKVENLRLDLV